MNLEKLLFKNYKQLREGDVENLKRVILQYLKNHDSVMNRNPLFIKRFTRVSDLIIKKKNSLFNSGSNEKSNSDEDLKDLYERLYQYHAEGAVKIRNELSIDKLALESHILSDGGDVAQKIFRDSNDLKWLKRAFGAYIASARIGEKFDSVFSHYTYEFAGKTAKELYKKTGDVRWAVESFEANKSCALTALKYNNKVEAAKAFSYAGDAARAVFKRNNSLKWALKWFGANFSSIEFRKGCCEKLMMYTSGFTGDAAKAIYKITKDTKWIIKSYYYDILSASIARKQDIIHAYNSYSFSAMSAKKIFYETGDIKWGLRWYASDNLAAKLSEKRDKSFSYVIYGFAATASREIYKRTKKKDYGLKWFELQKKSADISESINPKYSYYAYLFTGNSAYNLSKVYGREWTKRALECYEKSFKIYMKNPYINNEKSRDILIRNIRSLRRILENKENTVNKWNKTNKRIN